MTRSEAPMNTAPDTAPLDPRTVRNDRWLFIVLAVVLVAASVAVSIQMLKPSDRKAVTRSLEQDGLAIISASQTWIANMPASLDTTGRPFDLLRFDRIGYLDGLSPDARVMSNEHGRYTMVVAPDGKSFDLMALGPDAITVEWDHITTEGVPKPKER